MVCECMYVQCYVPSLHTAQTLLRNLLILWFLTALYNNKNYWYW